MGKKQHQSDKLYLTANEWSTYYGGKKQEQQGPNAKFRRLPFSCCSISMQPFENPYCTMEGNIFDLEYIFPFLKKYGINPVNGKKLSAKDLIQLHFQKNSKGQYHCPVTFKVFNENTHVVAIKTTGNVYAMEAVERLNIKAKHWKDLMNDESFTRADIITIQDPTELSKFNLADFYHLKKGLKVDDEEERQARKDPKYKLKAINAETKDILNELDTTYKPEEKKADNKKKADAVNAAHYSTGAVAASFTSTATDRSTHQEAAVIDEDKLKYERVKKKGYARLNTNLGPLNIELHCDMVPKTCENFLLLCQKGYYNGTLFHRSIRNFMIQGGDPTGTGKGGESIWGGAFADEFKPNLTHTGRGVLSMANSGTNTNKSQFFITYRSARHLDNKHTVFGKVVGGMDTIDKMEKRETDIKGGDRPLEDIILESCQVFGNPYEEATEQLQKEREERVTKAAEDSAASKPKKSKVVEESSMKVYKTSGVGKYLNPSTSKVMSSEPAEPVVKKKKTAASSFGDFSNW
ncbi:RING-type E3 ubiquitin-protein ligase PPIL2-like [Watersipora subatra]|uniref:RING-type E3 ubiquitin-protein ligase PPIL2-like n=1 Tax=Watersipora subatra TaxID=2589382 RepID=UPI00355BED68